MPKKLVVEKPVVDDRRQSAEMLLMDVRRQSLRSERDDVEARRLWAVCGRLRGDLRAGRLDYAEVDGLAREAVEAGLIEVR
jgi:hypothetical protein